jgi:hypothetical protein
VLSSVDPDPVPATTLFLPLYLGHIAFFLLLLFFKALFAMADSRSPAECSSAYAGRREHTYYSNGLNLDRVKSTVSSFLRHRQLERHRGQLTFMAPVDPGCPTQSILVASKGCMENLVRRG